MWKVAVTSFVILTLSRGVLSQCKPGDTCKPPNCRCWNDVDIPGGFQPKDVPQIIIVSFEYAVNRANVDSYIELFDGISNPNKCEPRGTFFVSELNTDFEVVKSLFDDGHEIAMTTPSGSIPLDAKEWKEAFAEMKAKITGAGIPEADITGTRGPELYIGGNDQFDSIVDNKLKYDSTCVSTEYIDKENLIWPYTYDFIENTPACTIGETPAKPYPGKWQFLVADMKFGTTKCAAPSACSLLIKDSQDAFDFFYDSFALHYEGKTRAPFVMFIDPQWLTDTWIVTNQQALAWIKDPVPSANATDFAPWDC
ncbi:chitin deacetylase 9 [Plakobranchus ocellatus]|uniref:Chitin deacetylase 9 n=1 Tax=Plakobranchus ocellatus TaxID=259542 RepID=A0AAV4CM12_9GAST|nr:chitin deacetylase 9 [Plakobranchus ocellatus]